VNQEDLDYCEDLAKRVYGTNEHVGTDCWKKHPECMVLALLAEVNRLRTELNAAKAYDYRSYGPPMWQPPGGH
jgi:hypothetical protein